MTRSTRDSLRTERGGPSGSRELYSIKSGRPTLYKIGTVFGQLTIVDRYANRVVLECSCGNIIEVSMPAIIQGGKRDCGCISAKKAAAASSSRDNSRMLWYTWHHMIARCEDPEHPHYKDYGGRGISVCARWHDFETFTSDLGLRPDGMTLDRENNDGNYEPSNCRWATVTEQARNRRPISRRNNTLGSEITFHEEGE